MDTLFDGLMTVAAGLLVGAACRVAIDAWDPARAEARTSLTDARLEAFLEAAVRYR
ncbi:MULTISPECIES: hypothetical protein [unclassified Nocardioides]|uniref:hypothetical protein n=1 Tax=unclassified Nocardioides TaxID=2615069 RepID=UPI0030152DDC